MKWWIFICLLVLCSCSSNRPFVFTNASQMGDLYVDGELTDQHGNRWEVWLVPGMSPMFELSKDGWKGSRQALKEYADSEFWEYCVDLNKNLLVFSKACFTEYLIEGIAEDFSKATTDISANVRETPFGWIPRIGGNVFWGYIFRPTFRMVTAPVGIGFGLTGSVVFPVGKALSPVPIAVGNIIGNGIVLPAAGIAAHQVIYLFAIPNREPSVEHNGRFGLYVIRWKDGKVPEEYAEVEPEDAIYDEEIVEDDNEEEVVEDYDEELEKIDVERLKKITSEYVELQKYSLLFEVGNGSKDSNLFIKIKSELFGLCSITKEAEKYYEGGELENYFIKIWHEMKVQLTDKQKEKILTGEQAFLSFKMNILQQLGFD
ncbi:hypothetical protein [Candidatus Uabimicrobium amorphum]|uniref:PEGA domain-containing protein n=1 Tax=Uabimicrobium amorphum TaxID=2596890 RepID=A0A5S9IMM2_UABAM|nr:hypothetical protein [Candidatus Uabimicrobium amorphum]BBM84504.1 hypothetical protein UABAM_02865 [Candidatus Uabimicrobium amorphum]